MHGWFKKKQNIHFWISGKFFFSYKSKKVIVNTACSAPHTSSTTHTISCHSCCRVITPLCLFISLTLDIIWVQKEDSLKHGVDKGN